MLKYIFCSFVITLYINQSMKKYISDFIVKTNERLHANYCLLKLKPQEGE